MALITLINAQLAFGHIALLDRTDFSLEEHERIGLIGRNGTGKTSLLKILAGLEKPDDGTMQLQQNMRLAYVAQEPFLDLNATVFEVVSLGVAGAINLIDAYSQGNGDLDALQDAIEAQDGWKFDLDLVRRSEGRLTCTCFTYQTHAVCAHVFTIAIKIDERAAEAAAEFDHHWNSLAKALQELRASIEKAGL